MRYGSVCSGIEAASVAFGLELGNQGSGGNVGWHGPDRPFRTFDTGTPPGVATYMETPWDAQEKRIHDVRRGTAPTLSSRSNGGGTVDGWFATNTAIRRLTPTECERLQGFPDGWTDVPHRGKPAADGPRYKAIGNSMAVPVMRWIGQRIAAVDALIARPSERSAA